MTNATFSLDMPHYDSSNRPLAFPSPRAAPLGRGGIDDNDGCNRSKIERRQIAQFETGNNYLSKAPSGRGGVLVGHRELRRLVDVCNRPIGKPGE